VRRDENFATFMSRLSGNAGSFNVLDPERPVWPCTGIVYPLNGCTNLSKI